MTEYDLLPSEIRTEDGQYWSVYNDYGDDVVRIARLDTYLTRPDLVAMIDAIDRNRQLEIKES